jgi:hypothetical protein
MSHLPIPLLFLIVTNAAAWAAGRLIPRRALLPLDGGLVMADGERLLGNHKTWGGLIAGAIGCGLVSTLVRHSFLLGGAFGLLSLAGDCGSSFVKRRLRLRPGTEVPVLDQLPEALVPLLALGHRLGLTPIAGLAIVALFALFDLAAAELRRRMP